MPRAQANRTFTFPGYSFNDSAAAVDFETSLVCVKDVPAIVTAQSAGTLTTRTDNDTGVVTLATGHGITTGMKCDVYWTGGKRYGMDATVATNAITLDGGAGDNLPTEATENIAVVKQLDVEVNFDGDDAQIIGVFYRNPSDTGANGHLDLLDAGAASIEAIDLVHETANGGVDNVWDIVGGDANAFTGNRVTIGKVTHDSLTAAKLYICVGLVAP